jgi:hypothetical protein
MARNNALNFSRLSKYNYEYLSLEEVIFLEYLIFHQVRKIEIPVQSSRIEQETGLKKHRQQKALELLTEKGFAVVDNQTNRRRVSLNAEKVALSPQRIFLKVNKSIIRFLGQLIAVPTTKEKEKAKLQPISKPKKAVKSASGKAVLPVNQIGLFD